MQVAVDLDAQARALARIRTLSRPIVLLATIALAAAVLVPTAQILVILFFPNHLGSLSSFLSFNGWGVGLLMVGTDSHLPGGTFVPLDSLGLEQRCAVAALLGLCAICSALALFQLRSLFALYSRGIVFAETNIRRIKAFGMWLVLAAIAANVAGRLYLWVTHAAVDGTPNAALIVVLGVMIYVIAHVMELGREADLERKDFI
jgi:hypothetical protein